MVCTMLPALVSLWSATPFARVVILVRVSAALDSFTF